MNKNTLSRREFVGASFAASLLAGSLALNGCNNNQDPENELINEIIDAPPEYIAGPDKEAIMIDGGFSGMLEEDVDAIKDQLGYTIFKTYCPLNEESYKKYATAIPYVCADYNLPVSDKEALLGRVIWVDCQDGRAILNTKTGKLIIGDGTSFFYTSEAEKYDICLVIFGTDEQCAAQIEEEEKKFIEGIEGNF